MMKATFTVSIRSSNDAFQDGNAAAEVQRILKKIANQLPVSDGEVIKDVNGNTVGDWCLTVEPESDDDEEDDDAWKVPCPECGLPALDDDVLYYGMCYACWNIYGYADDMEADNV